MEKPNIRNKSNIVLQRSEVGKAKPGAGKLPSNDFTYGHPKIINEVDGKASIFTWAMSTQTPAQNMPTDFRKVNKFALPRQTRAGMGNCMPPNMKVSKIDR